MSENPFEILRLAPTASEQEVMTQAERLCQRAGDEEARNRYREAARQLTATAEERELFALLTFPSAEHESRDLERFIAAHRRPPAGPLQEEKPVVPALDVDVVRGLVLQALAADLEPTPLPLAVVESGEPVEEINRQTAEALWQSLLSDMRA